MKKFGLIGHPIGHSLSPALFKAGYDGRYPYDLIQGEDFETSYHRFIEEYDGINVTAPFKEMAYAKADIVSEECRLCKAANLLVKTPEGIKAYNSDFLGVRLWLQETLRRQSGDEMDDKRTPPTSWAPPPAARGVARFSASISSPDYRKSSATKVLVVGTGGAGRAAAVAAASLGVKTVLMNRNQDRAIRLAEDLRETGFDSEVRSLADFRECFREAGIIIYNLPVAIPELHSLTDTDFAPGNPKDTFEANYRSPSFDGGFTERMKNANPMARHTGGRTWLLYQALTGYEIFTEEKPDLAKMSAVL